MVDLASAKRRAIDGARLGYRLLDETAAEYTRDRAELAAAGLAFFTLLSMAPLMLISVAIAGAVMGESSAREAALATVRETMGSVAAETVGGWVAQAYASRGVASVVGFGLVLYAASRLTAQLRVALNLVWNVERKVDDTFKHSVREYARRRLFAFLAVLASGPLLLLVFASRALLSGLHEAVLARLPLAGSLIELTQLGFSLLVVAAVSALVFKVIPDTQVPWAAVVTGALVTSLLFNVGNWFVGLYLGRASIAHAYGAAGSLMVVLLWLYFSAQMFLFGAEFTQVYARHFVARKGSVC